MVGLDGSNRASKAMEIESLVFRQSELPMIVLDGQSLRVLQGNLAASKLIDPKSSGLAGMPFADFLPASDEQRLKEAAQSLIAGQRIKCLDGLMVKSAGGELLAFEARMSSLMLDSVSGLLIVLIPCLTGVSNRDSHRKQNVKIEELVVALSRQLHWERIVRVISTSIYSTFDRDTILQTAVDALARAFAVNRGLIVRIEGPASPMVTHEFVQPDISPLGLGRTSQFPMSAAACFKTRSVGFADLSKPPGPAELSAKDRVQLLESGVVSMIGGPISHHGQYHGLVVVMQSDKPREWTSQEIDLLETVANQVAIALGHARSYGQLKDQLFNMNLIGNLTQQLTNILDVASRSTRPDAYLEASKALNALPPLSGRELEVLRLIASGLANREIAQHLFLTESTVELHASRIRKKLKLKSRTALVKYACDNHLV